MTEPMHPIRQILSWLLQPGEQWHALFSCGHRANFGRGPQPSATEYRCAECPRS